MCGWRYDSGGQSARQRLTGAEVKIKSKNIGLALCNFGWSPVVEVTADTRSVQQVRTNASAFNVTPLTGLTKETQRCLKELYRSLI